MSNLLYEESRMINIEWNDAIGPNKPKESSISMALYNVGDFITSPTKFQCPPHYLRVVNIKLAGVITRSSVEAFHFMSKPSELIRESISLFDQLVQEYPDERIRIEGEWR